MANKTASSTDVREVVTGNTVGRNIASDVTPVHRENITGDGFGVDIFAHVLPGTAREVLTGDGVGKTTFADVLPGTMREVVTGDGVGALWYGGVAGAWREAIIRQAPFSMSSTVREVILSLPNEPLTPHHQTVNFRQSVLMVRPATASPPSVKSNRYIPTMRELVVQQAVRPWAISDKFVQTLRHQTIQRRFFTPTGQVISSDFVKTMRHITVQSRTKSYQPVSADYVKTQRQLVVQHRVVPNAPGVWSFIRVGNEFQLVVLSRKVIVVQKEPGFTAQLFEEVVQARTPNEYIGMEHAASLRQLVVQERTLGGGGPIPNGYQYVVTERMLVVQRRETPPPVETDDWRIKHFGMTAIQQRTDMSVITRAPIDVGMMRVQYVLAMDYPAPPDVMGPEDGVFMQQYAQKIVQHRVTESPNMYAHANYVFSVAQRPVLEDDGFPDKDTAYSDVDVRSLAQQVLLREPLDEYPDPTIPVSDAQVYSLQEKVLVTDAYPDPTLPNSEATVYWLGQAVVVSEPDMIDPTLPQSLVDVQLVGEKVVVTDNEFADPATVYSPVKVFAVQQFIVTPDPAMMRIPSRVNRRRPVITVSMS